MAKFKPPSIRQGVGPLRYEPLKSPKKGFTHMAKANRQTKKSRHPAV